MSLLKYEEAIRELQLLHIAMEGLAAGCENIVEMHGAQKFTDAMTLLIDEARARAQQLEALFDEALQLEENLIKERA